MLDRALEVDPSFVDVKIDSFYPGIAQISGEAVTGWNEWTIRTAAVDPLFRDLSDEVARKRFSEETMGLLTKFGLDIKEDNPVFVQIQYARHGFDAAKAAFLSTYTEDMYILAGWWHRFKRAPWAAELRADPDVVAVMAARELRIAELRQQVLELMQEPEWKE